MEARKDETNGEYSKWNIDQAFLCMQDKTESLK